MMPSSLIHDRSDTRFSCWVLPAAPTLTSGYCDPPQSHRQSCPATRMTLVHPYDQPLAHFRNRTERTAFGHRRPEG
jgi:hypothetical protein